MAEQHLGLYSDQDYVGKIILSRCQRLAVVEPKRTRYPQAALHRWVSLITCSKLANATSKRPVGPSIYSSGRNEAESFAD